MPGVPVISPHLPSVHSVAPFPGPPQGVRRDVYTGLLGQPDKDTNKPTKGKARSVYRLE